MKGDPDINVCPKCGGYADNGFDRSYPPNPYHCSKCDPDMCQNIEEDCTTLQPRLNEFSRKGSIFLREYCDACYVKAKTPKWIMSRMRELEEKLFKLALDNQN